MLLRIYAHHVPQCSGYNQAVHASNLAFMTSFLGLHFAASRFSSTPKILYQSYSELLLRLAYLKVGKVGNLLAFEIVQVLGL